MIDRRVLVGTRKSPDGRWVDLEEVQIAAARLFERGEVEIIMPAVGYRSAFVGAALASIPGTTTAVRARRVLLVSEQSRF